MKVKRNSGQECTVVGGGSSGKCGIITGQEIDIGFSLPASGPLPHVLKGRYRCTNGHDATRSGRRLEQAGSNGCRDRRITWVERNIIYLPPPVRCMANAIFPFQSVHSGDFYLQRSSFDTLMVTLTRRLLNIWIFCVFIIHIMLHLNNTHMCSHISHVIQVRNHL